MTDRTTELAFGRILRMASRPAQPGDVAEYERCRTIILNALGNPEVVDYSHNYARDRLKGAAGD